MYRTHAAAFILFYKCEFYSVLSRLVPVPMTVVHLNFTAIIILYAQCVIINTSF